MSNWDSDIASLLDDVLHDKEPAVEAKPDTPEPSQDDEVVTSDDLVTEPLSTNEPDENLVEVDGELVDAGDMYDDRHTEEVTTVVSKDTDTIEEDLAADAALAALPEIDFSKPVKDDEMIPMPEFTSDELMEEIDVRNFGTLVSLTNRRWHAKIKDRKAAKDAADTAGATAETFEARKRLLVGADAKLKAVHKIIDAARTEHYGMTLPWSTVGINDIGKRAGPRLLANKSLFDYSQKMGAYKAEMDSALDDFVDSYPTLIAIAQQKMGTAFNQSDYPHPDTIREHFALEFDFEPIPSGGDFQGLQDAQVEKLSSALQRKTRKRLENAMQDAWSRLYETVQHAAATLSNPDAMFHYTMVDKLREQATVLKHLNVISDPRIEEIRAGVEKELTLHDAADVRKDDALRRRLGDAASELRDKMKEYAA
jgi:uncharacterized protein YdbL (DUF1318 family)